MRVKKQRQDIMQIRSDAQVAIILANNQPWSSWFEPALAQVGTLPVLLRAILGVQGTNPERIIVVFNRVTGPQIRQELLKTRRLPACIEWIEVAVGTTLSSIVRWVSAKSGNARVLLVAGDRTYQPALHRLVSEWDGQRSTLELASGSEPAGLFALSHEAACELGADTESNVVTVRDLHRWITRKAILNGPSFVDFKLVEEDSWQKISMPQDSIVAEQKLDRWLVKPTDGVFARMNRRISIPISRQLIKFPITPNMVSGFTLGVSFAAGVSYAMGGYWNTLLGAILSVWASILDGCDGEVARLKLQATDFGCWLETACDYLYYLFIFAGMTVGLVRSSGNRAFGAWGAALLFGAATTILLAWFERSRLSSKHPEQFLAVWQKKAESRSSNPLLYLGRRCEFIIRRCFLPYALLAFAVLNLNWLALYMSAIGANIAWIVSLYSRFAFSSKSRAAAKTPAAPEGKPIIV
ncbi:MAG: CDP-alcohol phosphatidyltransferase family protein [Terracidiphilus sp.]